MTHRLLKDGPLDADFWTGEISSKLPATFRIGFGGLLLGDALLALNDVRHLYGPAGVWPAQLAKGPLANLSEGGILAFWLAGCAALALFTLGYFTRIAAALSWAFLVCIHQRNEGITTGGDYLAQILLFFCLFLDTGAAYSLDAKLRRQARAFVSAAPLRAMQLHIAVLYFVATRLKVRGGWLSGDGIYLSLQHLGFLRPPGQWVLDHPELARVSTWLVLLLEGAFAFLAFCPVYPRVGRRLAILCAIAVQMGVFITMRVGVFTPLMLWINVLFVDVASRPSPHANTLRRWAPSLACGAVVVLIAWGAFVGRRFPLPQPIQTATYALGLTQPFDLFGATYEVAQWHASGRRADGKTVDVLAEAAPGLRSETGWRFSTYYKLTFANPVSHQAIARWLCERYGEQTGTQLSSLRFWKQARQPVRPRELRPFEERVFYEGPCPTSNAHASR